MTSAMSRAHRPRRPPPKEFARLRLARGVLWQGGMIRLLTALIAALLLASPAAAAQRPDECLALAARDGVLRGEFPPDAAHREIGAVRLRGSTLPDGALWDLAGGPPALPLLRSGAVALVSRLAQSGLFASVEAAIRTLPGEEAVELDIALADQPRVTSAQIRGLSEFRSEDVLDRLLQSPSVQQAEERRQELRDARPRDCPAPLPPPSMLARAEDGQVLPGILWQGLDPALARAQRYLRARGYGLARVEGRLGLDGALLVDVDEGRVGAIEVRGLDQHLAREVIDEIGIRRGDIFSSGELHSGLERVERRWPFVRAGSDAYEFDGDTLVINLEAERSRTRAQWIELIRHTPVTGFAPGLAGTWTIFDPADRAHLTLDGAFNVNTRRPNLDASAPNYFDRLEARQRVDWLAGARLRIPALDVAELGGQVHALTDTADAWRISDVDSYVYSALINRADREYYRRSGYAAFLTLHLFEELTVGAEYRRDRYLGLDIPHGVWSVFNQGNVLYGAAPVDPGEMGSTVFRFEYHSERTPLHKVGSMWRRPETSLVPPAPGRVELRTVDTVEVADPSMGGAFSFTKVVSDTSLTLETGRDDTVTLRLRGAGGRDLPLQKQEALGGWSALRGYDFKEFRGNGSLLGTLQLEGRHFGAFLDVGSVRQAGAGWIDPKASAGASFDFGGHTRAEAAWRLDGKARLAPDFRLLFAVPL